MEAPTPKFTDCFLVTDNYGDFIRIVRQNVIKYCTRRPNVYQDVLPPEKKIPELWFHIVLRTKTSSLTLAVRMDNLYLVGFRTTTGVWWEFGKEGDTRLISESTWLGFGESYQDLVGQKRLETITLGRAQMSFAVDALAKYPTEMILEGEEEDNPHAKQKLMLARLVIMICEGLRFLTVSGTVDKKFDEEAKIEPIEATHVNNWNKISKAVIIEWAKNPEAKIPSMEAIGIKDKNTAARIVALVKDQTSTGEDKNEL